MDSHIESEYSRKITVHCNQNSVHVLCNLNMYSTEYNTFHTHRNQTVTMGLASREGREGAEVRTIQSLRLLQCPAVAIAAGV